VSDHYFYISSGTDDEGNKEQLQLQMFCFNPAFIFEDIKEKQPRSFIITSGSLGDIATLEYEL
jgi:hypothetical protein